MPLNKSLAGNPFSEGRAPRPQEAGSSNPGSQVREKLSLQALTLTQAHFHLPKGRHLIKRS